MYCEGARTLNLYAGCAENTPHLHPFRNFLFKPFKVSLVIYNREMERIKNAVPTHKYLQDNVKTFGHSESKTLEPSNSPPADKTEKQDEDMKQDEKIEQDSLDPVILPADTPDKQDEERTQETLNPVIPPVTDISVSMVDDDITEELEERILCSDKQ